MCLPPPMHCKNTDLFRLLFVNNYIDDSNNKNNKTLKVVHFYGSTDLPGGYGVSALTLHHLEIIFLKNKQPVKSKRAVFLFLAEVSLFF